jgi:hypothetical protein
MAGACYRCGFPLGSNAAACWWCDFYARSLKR